MPVQPRGRRRTAALAAVLLAGALTLPAAAPGSGTGRLLASRALDLPDATAATPHRALDLPAAADEPGSGTRRRVLVLPGAVADAPLRLNEQITDDADALGNRRGEVQAALDGLRTGEGLQLFVVYVHSFDGIPAQRWTDQTAQRSDLGTNDALLAVATRDRAYAYSVDSQAGLSDQQLATVARVAIEPALAENDWPGAAIGAANGYAAILRGAPVVAPTIQPGPPDNSADTIGLGWLWLVLCLGFVALLIAWLVWWLRRPKATATTAAESGAPPAHADPLAAVGTEELARRANAWLVTIDDALKTSEQELGFASAAYGQPATAEFAAALTAAKADAAEVFRLRALLYDDTPEDEPTRRQMFAEIIHRCEGADQRLDAQADSFDALRALESRVDTAIPATAQRRTAVFATLPDAVAVLADLRRRYAESACAAVAENVTQASERLTYAATALAEAETAVGHGDRSAAAVSVRGAEQAVGQAETLLAAIGTTAADLADARTAADAELAEIDAEVADARTAAASMTDGQAAALTVAATEAQRAADRARAALAEPQPDPLAVLRGLKQADDRLDRELAAVREDADRRRRSRQLLDQALLTARAEVSAAGDFITTRRGAVGGEARTRLAQAQQYLDRAVARADSDPAAALTDARQADDLAKQASRAARDDVGTWSGPHSGGGATIGGIGGAVLGGILLETILGGEGRDGGSHWGSRVPGTFGGSGTRTRQSGGGRF